MILSGATIEGLNIFEPFSPRTQHPETGMSFGLSMAGYDVRLDMDMPPRLLPPGGFLLASTLERFRMPKHIIGVVHDKSTLARQGIALQNTVIEPGWEGFLTVEISNHSNDKWFDIIPGMPIAQILFHALDQEVDGYEGKYQNQGRGPVGPR